MCDPLSVVTLRPEQRDQRQLGDHDNDDQGGKGAERVHVVRGAEPPAANERGAEPEPFDHRRSRGEPEEREPGDRGEHGGPLEQGHGSEDEHRRQVRDRA